MIDYVILPARSVRVVAGLILALICLGACASQRLAEGTDGTAIVTGKKTWQEWQKEAGSMPYPNEEMTGLESKLKRISKLQGERNAEFLIFGGSWCPDTESQLPRIMKILELSSVPDNRIKLYGLDREKNEPTGTAKSFSIQKVPTLVVVAQGRELGRVVEYPAISWEDDLIAVLER